MATSENILDSIAGVNRYMSLMRMASAEKEIVDAMSKYLASWSVHKVENLQKIDGGWGPFDRSGRPTRLSTVADVLWIGDTMRRHRVALQEAGIAPNPELAELDLFCFVARQVAEDRVGIRSAARSVADRQGAFPQWGSGQKSDRHVGRN